MPYVHDELSYLIQARQFATGHLWTRPHPLGVFFDSFQLLVTPVYASAYFPGTALLYVPGIWAHAAPWVTSLLIAGAIAGLLYRIVAELIDGLAGWLAVLLLWSDRIYRSLSTMVLGQAPLLLFSLLAVYGWLKWTRTESRRWAVFIGLSLGLAVVTRPVDALCVAVPICAAVFCKMLGRFRAGDRARCLIPVAWLVAGALPGLTLQVTLNYGITGDVFRTPFRLYADRDYPGTAFGFRPIDAAAKPVSDLPQKQALYAEDRPLIFRHRPWPAVLETLRFRLPLALTQAAPAPFPLLIVLLPLSVVGLDRRRIVFISAVPIFVLLYTGYVFFFPHYVLTVSAGVIGGALVGADQLRFAFGKHQRFWSIFPPLMITGLAAAALPQWDTTSDDEQFAAPLIAAVDERLLHLQHTPAVVLFRYDPRRNTNEEPVYNADADWPDDAVVVRAHDRGAENAALYRYYAERQPERFVYRFDERTRRLQELGPVQTLATTSR